MFERFTAGARAIVGAGPGARPPAGARLYRLRASPARRRFHRRTGGRRPARAASPRKAWRPRSSAGSGSGRRPACSAPWTVTRWPPSGSTSTPCGPRPRRRSGRTPSPGPPPAPAGGTGRVAGGPLALLRRSRRRRARPGRRRAGAPRPARPGTSRFTPRAKKSLQLSLREAVARQDGYIGAEHLTLALVGMNAGAVPPILSALGTTQAALRAAILDRYRQAS